MSTLPFFVREGDRYLPTDTARGYWTPQSLNGRAVVGLLGFELERLYGGPEWQPARLTVDMYRLPDRAPVQVTTRAIRQGGRLRLVEADFISGGQPMARASCQLIRRTAAAPGRFWTPAPWTAPAPETLASVPETPSRRWETRMIEGEMATFGFRRAWMRETCDLVGGCSLTPFVRVALAADFASPMSNSGSEGVSYINSDVTIYLHRLPTTEWIGFEQKNHQATDGVAIGECWLHDEAGPIGSASVAGVAHTRQTPPASA